MVYSRGERMAMCTKTGGITIVTVTPNETMAWNPVGLPATLSCAESSDGNPAIEGMLTSEFNHWPPKQ